MRDTAGGVVCVALSAIIRSLPLVGVALHVVSQVLPVRQELVVLPVCSVVRPVDVHATLHSHKSRVQRWVVAAARLRAWRNGFGIG